MVRRAEPSRRRCPTASNPIAVNLLLWSDSRQLTAVVLFFRSEPMSSAVRLFAVPAASLLLLSAAAGADGELRGYTAESSKIERNWESKFRAIPEPARMREALRRLAARPHHVGSPYDQDNAEWLRD